MKGEKKMREYLKGEMGDDAFNVMKGKLEVADLFKMAKGMGYDGEGPDDEDDEDEIDEEVEIDEEDMEKSGRMILDALADAVGTVNAERQTDLFDTLVKGMRDSAPFADALDEADGLRKSNADAGRLIKSLVSGVDHAFRSVVSVVEALGDRLDGQSELVTLGGEAAIQQREALNGLRGEVAELRKSLGLPDPQGLTATPAKRFPGEGAAHAKVDPADLNALHGEAMASLRKSMRGAKGAAKVRLGQTSDQIASLGAVVGRYGEKTPEILRGIADGTLIEKITG